MPDVIINPATGNITIDTNGLKIGNIVIDSAAGIFTGADSLDWDASGQFSSDLDTQISMPIAFGGPGFNGLDDLGKNIIGDLPAGFDFLADLTVTYLDSASGELLPGNAIIVPEPSSMVLATFGVLGMLGYLRRRRLGDHRLRRALNSMSVAKK